MELYWDLPDVLRNLQVEYLSLPELIDYGIATPTRLTDIVRNTLGIQFINASKPELDVLVGDLFESGLDSTHIEGLTALLLLDRLNLDQVTSNDKLDHHTTQLVDYFVRQSSEFKKIVYPHFVEMYNRHRSKFVQGVFTYLVETESINPNSAGLDILYDIDPGMLLFVDPIVLTEENPQFLIRHLHEIAVVPSMIFVSVNTNNHALTKVLVERFVTLANINRLRHFDKKIDPYEFDDMLYVLGTTMPDLAGLIPTTGLTVLFPSDVTLYY